MTRRGVCVGAQLTGWGPEDDRRRTREAGFNYHLVTPPDAKALEELLAPLKQEMFD